MMAAEQTGAAETPHDARAALTQAPIPTAMGSGMSGAWLRNSMVVSDAVSVVAHEWSLIVCAAEFARVPPVLDDPAATATTVDVDAPVLPTVARSNENTSRSSLAHKQHTQHTQQHTTARTNTHSTHNTRKHTHNKHQAANTSTTASEAHARRLSVWHVLLWYGLCCSCLMCEMCCHVDATRHFHGQHITRDVH